MKFADCDDETLATSSRRLHAVRSNAAALLRRAIRSSSTLIFLSLNFMQDVRYHFSHPGLLERLQYVDKCMKENGAGEKKETKKTQ